MACSGCGKRRRAPSPPPPRIVSMQPQDGMTLIDYIGGGGKSLWIGKSTGTKYIFGNIQSHKRKFVYNEDLDGFLSILKQFAIAEVPPIGDEEPKPALEAVMGG